MKTAQLPKLDISAFPADASKGYPHVINLEDKDFDEDSECLSELTLADGVATFIYNWEKATGTTDLVGKFFGRLSEEDAQKSGRRAGEFAVDECCIESTADGWLPLLIARKNDVVTVSLRSGSVLTMP
jgi:hypothetical protein